VPSRASAMWQTAGGSETWPVPTGRHHRGRRSRRGARPITSLLSKSGHTPNKRSLPNVRFAPLPKVAPVLPCGVARAKPLESPPAKLSPLWYSSPPTSAPSSPVRPGPRMRTCSSLLGATTRVRSPSRVSVRYQGGSRALTPFPTRSLGSEPQAGLQPSHSPEKAPEPEPEPELQPQTETEPEPEPEPNPAELEAQLEAQALQKEKARRVGHLKSTMKVRFGRAPLSMLVWFGRETHFAGKRNRVLTQARSVCLPRRVCRGCKERSGC
jgi:hypothetical protein